MNWNGVMPAVTTCFNQDLAVDHPFVAEHCRWLLDNGCTGVVTLGSLGEGATLSFDEKMEIIPTSVKHEAGRGRGRALWVHGLEVLLGGAMPFLERTGSARRVGLLAWPIHCRESPLNCLIAESM